MTSDLGSLSITAVLIGFVHCICGPDHYIPFVAMSRVGLWSLRKTVLVTVICGIGHVAGSALIGLLGIALGIIVLQLEAAEAVRGDLAGWLLLAFGVAYTGYGLWVMRRRWKERREAVAADLSSEEADSEDPAAPKKVGSYTPLALFVVFVFGPCEPLIPLLMYPAAKANIWSVLWVTTLFGVTTLITMTALVTLIYKGAATLRFPAAETYGHTIAGLAVVACAIAILVGL